MEGYLAEIRMFAGNFAPKNWMLCNGQLLSISQDTALFTLLGTTYGGDGRQTFALPDFQGRHAVGTGQSPTGIRSAGLGQKAAAPAVGAGSGILGMNYIICIEGTFPSRS